MHPLRPSACTNMAADLAGAPGPLHLVDGALDAVFDARRRARLLSCVVQAGSAAMHGGGRRHYACCCVVEAIGACMGLAPQHTRTCAGLARRDQHGVLVEDGLLQRIGVGALNHNWRLPGRRRRVGGDDVGVGRRAGGACTQRRTCRLNHLPIQARCNDAPQLTTRSTAWPRGAATSSSAISRICSLDILAVLRMGR